MAFRPGAPAPVETACRTPVGQPTYHVIKGDIFTIPTNAIVVPVSANLEQDIDRTRFPVRAPSNHEWRRLALGLPWPASLRAGPATAPTDHNLMPVGSFTQIDQFNVRNIKGRLSPSPLTTVNARAAPITNPPLTSNMLVMVRGHPRVRPTPASGIVPAVRTAAQRHGELVNMYKRALHQAYNPYQEPTPAGTPLVPPPAASISFPLIGAGELGYSPTECARAAFTACLSFFNSPTSGAARLGQIQDINFVVAPPTWAKDKQPEGRKLRALNQAFRALILPLPQTAQVAGGPVIPAAITPA